MYTTKNACELTEIPYETIKFYCKQGLVPNIKRDKNNHRVFTDRNIAWLKSLQCLKKCGFSLKDIKIYMNLCFEGMSTVTIRREMLESTKAHLLSKLKDIEESLCYIDKKREFYDNVLTGKEEYRSNLLD